MSAKGLYSSRFGAVACHVRLCVVPMAAAAGEAKGAESHQAEEEPLIGFLLHAAALKDGVKYIVESTAQKGLDNPHKITLNILPGLQVHTVCSDHLCVLIWLRLMVEPMQAKQGLQADVSTKKRARTPQSP